jgi:ABC-type uncharacterized transport system substrate-binding protein
MSALPPKATLKAFFRMSGKGPIADICRQLIFSMSPGFQALSKKARVIALAARHRLPTVYPLRTFVEAGGLMSYGTDQNDMFRLAAFYVDRILRGDKPAELPVRAPTRFETSINVKTAKALGLTVPPGLLVAADVVIE